MADAANRSLATILQSSTETNLYQLLSLKRDFAMEWWQQYKSNPAGGLSVRLTDDHFPYLARSRVVLGREIKLAWANLQAERYQEDSVSLSGSSLPVTVTLSESQLASSDPYLIVPFALRSTP